MFKIETHLHTTVISPCGRVAPEQIVARYHEAGYDGIIVTDHYQLEAFRFAGIDLNGTGKKLEAFLEGYRQVKTCADRIGMRVYYGAELEFTENRNHYLLYGFSSELLADPAAVCAMGIAEFSSLAREDGALLIQAHPYRDRCVPVAPYLVDGIESVNRHDKHRNRNHLAIALAEKYQLLQSSGGDFHDPEDICVAGIGADHLPEDSFAMAELLRSGNFQLLGQR